jgi:hypothetical protein
MEADHCAHEDALAAIEVQVLYVLTLGTANDVAE